MNTFDLTSVLESTEREVLNNIDPFFHYVLLEAVSKGNLPNYKLHGSDGNEISDHEVVDLLRASEEKLGDHVRSLGRVFRYFASETMFLLLLSGRPFGPFVRTVSMLRYGKLNSAFEAISERRIPRGFEINSNKESLSFEPWLSQRISGDASWLQGQSERDDLIGLVVEEANMLKERGAVNAFKHGKPFAVGKSPKLKISDPEAGQEARNVQLDGINWIEWSERAADISIAYCSEEIIPEQDKMRIFALGLLTNALRKVRLAWLDNTSSFETTYPVDFKLGLDVRRQLVALNFSPNLPTEGT